MEEKSHFDIPLEQTEPICPVVEELIKKYLYRLRDEGKIYFEKELSKSDIQFVFNTIMKGHGL